MHLLSVFDTTLVEYNLGNQIIMDAVYRYLNQVFPDAFYIKIPYAEPLSRKSLAYLDESDLLFFGGTNSLSSDLRKYKQWGIDNRSSKRVKNLILMGVGWWQYQQGVTPYTKEVLHRVLHHDLLHAVRDNYTAAKLREAGFDNIVVTACPSMWNLTPEHCQTIPQHKAGTVIFTLTDYNQDRKNDTALIRLLQRKYDNVFCWIQGLGDYTYVTQLEPDIQFIPPNLQALDSFLDSHQDVEYVGTRLHAGIRALQAKRRAIILGIDNRAIEKGKDFNLPVVPRGDLDAIERMIDQPFATEIQLPQSDIERWLNQFQNIPKSYKFKTPRKPSFPRLRRIARWIRG